MSPMHCVFSGQIALGFMSWYVEMVCDRNPEADRLILPVGITKKDIFAEYCRTTDVEEIIGKSRFYDLWVKNFPNVSQPKVFYLP